MLFSRPDISISGISLYQELDKFRLIINTKLVGSSMFEWSLDFLIPITLSDAAVKKTKVLVIIPNVCGL